LLFTGVGLFFLSWFYASEIMAQNGVPSSINKNGYFTKIEADSSIYNDKESTTTDLVGGMKSEPYLFFIQLSNKVASPMRWIPFTTD